MSAIQGTHVAAPIVPGDTADIFPSHVDTYGRGGYRAVADDAARDAIPAPRRSAGMLIWHEADQAYYRLASDLTSWEAGPGGGGGGDFIPSAALDTDSTMAANSDSRVPSQKAVKTALDLKLDASAYNDRFKGLYSTLSALQAAHPTGAAGDYAQVDSGIGGTPHIYSWDVSDGAWVLTSADGTGAANTDQLPEGSTHLYFTAARAVAACTGVFQAASTILSAIAGFTASTGFLKFASGTPSVGPISASDVSGLGSAATHAADDFATAAQALALAGYDLPFCFEGSPGAGARLAAILLVRPVWMPFDLDGSIFRVDGAAGDYALAVQHLRDGEVLVAGTATLHPGGTATLLLDGDVDGQPGDELWISAPATPDAGVTSVRGTIKAEAVLP